MQFGPNEEYSEWPHSVNAPKLLDVLGTSVTLRCAKVPNARYTFQTAKSKASNLVWENTPYSTQSTESKS